MLYVDYISKATEITIKQADNGLYYLEPLWQAFLVDNNLDISVISNNTSVSWSIVYNVLKLEVEKRNTVNSLKPYVLNWIHDIITATVEPAILQEETDYIKNLTEYLKANKEAKLKDEDWNKFKQS